MTLPRVASVVGFGDSVTAGFNASQPSRRWLNLVSSALGAGAPLNKGVPGSILQDGLDASGRPRDWNGRSRWRAALTGSNKRDLAILAYGFNDARYIAAPTTLNVGDYREAYQAVIGGLLEQGYAADRLVVVAPYFISDLGLQSGTDGFRGQTRSGFEAYVAATRGIAAEAGVYFADAYSAMTTGGGEALIGPDHVHPNDAGHEVIARCVLSAQIEM